MTAGADQVISFEGVSKFYGDVLGVDRVTVTIPSGITSVVGPNGAGKSTLMNLLTGLLLPTRGRIRVLGVPVSDPERFFRLVGYCAQFDHLPRGATGRGFIYDTLRLHGLDHRLALEGTEEALERVGMSEAADRKMAGYSKGMRQRIRLAQSLAHHPRVLVLDEPLNGLDPMARAEVMDLLRAVAGQGMHVIISSHILHEVDRLSDRVILLSHGYVVAEGQIHDVRGEVEDRPMQILVRCSQPARLARLAFEQDHVVEAKILGTSVGTSLGTTVGANQDDSQGLLIRTRSADRFYALLNQAVVQDGIDVQAVVPADDDVGSVYQYLIGSDEGAPS